MSEEAELLGQIRKAVAEVREKGEKVIGVEALDAYLGELEDTVMLTREERARQHESQLEHFRATNASNLAQYAADVQLNVEMWKSMIAYGQEALKTAMLVNGGAGVAVLGFLSTMATKGLSPGMAANLPTALLFFACGVLATAIATGLTYLTQGFFVLRRDRIAEVIRGVVFALVVVWYGAFALGALQAYEAFR